MFNSKSAGDKGTLFQFKNLINRTSVPRDPQENVQATEDFLEVVLVAHIVTAAKSVFEEGMTLAEVCERIVDNFVKMHCDDTNSADTGKFLCKSIMHNVFKINQGLRI